jgi:outer membrane lipoprotein SlyB
LPTAANTPPGVVTAVAAAQGAQAAQTMQDAKGGRGAIPPDPMIGATAGAMAGALLGPSLERRAPAGPSSVYEVRIRMEDGSLRTYEQADAPPLGTKVIFEGSQPRWLAPRPAQAQPGSKVYSSY